MPGGGGGGGGGGGELVLILSYTVRLSSIVNNTFSFRL